MTKKNYRTHASRPKCFFQKSLPPAVWKIKSETFERLSVLLYVNEPEKINTLRAANRRTTSIIINNNCPRPTGRIIFKNHYFEKKTTKLNNLWSLKIRYAQICFRNKTWNVSSSKSNFAKCVLDRNRRSNRYARNRSNRYKRTNKYAFDKLGIWRICHQLRNQTRFFIILKQIINTMLQCALLRCFVVEL